MKTRILVYGDSNTWGSDAQGMRYSSDNQWVNIFQKKLGDAYEIVQEGLCGRIAGDHDRVDAHRNGRTGYEIALRSAAPFDYLIVALGSNDIKAKYSLTTNQIIEDLKWYRETTETYNRVDPDMESRFRDTIFVNIANYDESKFSVGNHDVGQELRQEISRQFDHTVDLSNLEHSEDGLHYSQKDHEQVAEHVYDKFKELEQ